MDTRVDLETSRHRLAELLEQREALELEIAKARRRVAALAELCDDTEETDKLMELNFNGLTDVCRTALQSSKRPLSISGLKAMLEFFEFPVETYKNPLATIQTTIRRMMDNGEVETAELPDGRTGYRWVPESSRKKRVAFKSRFNPERNRFKSKFEK